MTLATWQATVQDDDTGAAIVNPVITVRNAGDDSLADIYDMDGVPIANPVTGGLDGFIQFQASIGRYKIEAAKGGVDAADWYWDAVSVSGLSWSSLSEFTASVNGGLAVSDGTVVEVDGVKYVASSGSTDIAALGGWKYAEGYSPSQPAIAGREAIGLDESRAAIGLDASRVLFTTSGTHIVDPQVSAYPAINYALLPSSSTATFDCSSLYFNTDYKFISGTPGTTCVLDFGDDMYVRTPSLSASITDVTSVELPSNQVVTVTRLGGNQVFVDYGAPTYGVGTWEPEIYGSSSSGTNTYSIQRGRWVRNGNWVNISAYIVMSSTSGSTGNLRISGLPFAADGHPNDRFGLSVPYWLNFTSELSGATIWGDTDYIQLLTADGGDSPNLSASELTSTSRIVVSGGYYI